MIKHLVSAALALLLIAGIHLAVKAEVVGAQDHSNGELAILLHDTKGECLAGLTLAQVVHKPTGKVLAEGCWTEFDEKIGILWSGESAVRIGSRNLFRWAKS